jgi:hypothetical protein
MSEHSAENDRDHLDHLNGIRSETKALSDTTENDAGLRERMEALADLFDAKGRRGSAHFGADVGDTIRLWIDRDPRVTPPGEGHQ